MKELRCIKCNCYLGEMVGGKIKKDTILLCTECYKVYKTYEDLANYKSAAVKNDMPEFFKEIFDKKNMH